jgi:hypothetical protein
MGIEVIRYIGELRDNNNLSEPTAPETLPDVFEEPAE